MEQPDPMTELFGEPIYVYTQAQAIEDGELVDLTEWARETGLAFPTVCTRTVWSQIEYIPARSCQDVRGRAHDVLWMASLAVRAAIRRGADGAQRIPFQVDLKTAEAPALKRLVIAFSPAEGFCIMQPTED